MPRRTDTGRAFRSIQQVEADPLLPFPIALPLEDSTRFCRKVLGVRNKSFHDVGKQILEAVEEAAGLLELSR